MAVARYDAGIFRLHLGLIPFWHFYFWLSNMMFFLYCSALIIVAVTLLPETRFTHWSVRGLDFPRLQISFVALVILVLQLIFFRFDIAAQWLSFVGVTGALAWQLKWVLPYTPFWRKEVKKTEVDDPDNQISIITSNVLTPNHDSDKLISLVREYKPDVLVTLESDEWWQNKLDVLEDEMPYSLKCPLDNLYGMHLYSRLPFDEGSVEYLVKEDIPSMHCCMQLRSGEKIRMHFMHPEPPSPTESAFSSPRDAELTILARSAAESDQPLIVTGDLNDVAWSPTTRLFRHISGLLDPRIGRGAFNTFHADYPMLRWPLDHVFHSHHFTLNQIKRLPHIGSDHFSLYTSLNFTPRKGRDQEGETPDQEDRERAEEAAQEENASQKDVPEPGR